MPATSLETLTRLTVVCVEIGIARLDVEITCNLMRHLRLNALRTRLGDICIGIDIIRGGNVGYKIRLINNVIFNIAPVVRRVEIVYKVIVVVRAPYARI